MTSHHHYHHKSKQRRSSRISTRRSATGMHSFVLSSSSPCTDSTDDESSSTTSSCSLDLALQSPTTRAHLVPALPLHPHHSTLATTTSRTSGSSATASTSTAATASPAAVHGTTRPRPATITSNRRSSSFGTVTSVDTTYFSSSKWKIRRSVLLMLLVCGVIWTLFVLLLLIQFHSSTSTIHAVLGDSDTNGITFWEATRRHQRDNNYFVRRRQRQPHTSPAKHHSDTSSHLLLPTSSHIPLPLPTQKVSAILINYSRPRMIRESILMRTLLAHPNIDEVLLLHASPQTAFEFVHPKVINIDATQHNDEMGLSLRFYFCQLAKHDWILHVDDDMEFRTTALNELLIEYSKNPKRIVGRFGRDLSLGNFFDGYNSANTHKQTEVVLTKLMVMERQMCSAFFDYAPVLWDDVILSSGEGPLWNGEDIFMSLVANHVYSRAEQETGSVMPSTSYRNYAMDWLDVWQASDSLKDYQDGKLDISGGLTGYRLYDWKWWQMLLRRNRHYSYRGRLWQTAKQRLAQLDDA